MFLTISTKMQPVKHAHIQQAASSTCKGKTLSCIYLLYPGKILIMNEKNGK